MIYDNGGARAIRGMNYQNAVVTLVAVRNFQKSNFGIFVETEDDFVIEYDDYRAFIQVKGMGRIGLSKMLDKPQGATSMFEKQLRNGDSNSKYKFIVYHFTKSELNKMLEEDDELFERGKLLATDQRAEVEKQISDKAKLDNFRLIVTPFKNNLSDAKKQIIGEMVSQGLAVDKRGDLVFDELMQLIYQKSEHEIKNASDKQLKYLSSEELNSVLLKVEALNRFEKILDSLVMSELRRSRILKEKLKITTQFMTEKKVILSEMVKVEELEDLTEADVVDRFINLQELNHLENYTKIALVISAYCDVIEEVAFG